MTRKRMNRRIFLRGLGGAVVAAPFLSSVWERRSKGQAASAPKQLIVMFTHYGCLTTRWFPSRSHGAITADDLTPTTLAPLAPFAGKLLIPRGIRAMNEWTNSNNGTNGRGQGNDPHLQVVGSYFTLQPVTPNSNDPFSSDAATRFNARPVGSSLDHVIAQQLSPSGTPLVMRVGGLNEGPQSAISYLKSDAAATAAPADIYPGHGSPMTVFTSLTGLFGPGSPTPDDHAASRGKKVTDLVKGSLEDFERQDMSAEDRNKIAAWKAMVNETGTAVTRSCGLDLVTRLGATPEALNVTGNLASMVTPDLDGADMYSVMAVLAAACNANPVIFLKYPPSYVYSGLGVSKDTHSISHRLDNSGLTGMCAPNAIDLIRTIDKYHAAKFAKLVGMLDGLKNSDGSTLLDSSATVWFNEMSDGLAHNLNNLPIIQAGGCGGYFKTGWAVNVDTVNTGAANLSVGNSESQCYAGSSGIINGIDQSTGTAATIANAPINKYYCNLMNALGVKAAETGFPTKGGAAPVTHFGYSDQTTDFRGGLGGTAGAAIHNPGEFSALTAGT